MLNCLFRRAAFSPSPPIFYLTANSNTEPRKRVASSPCSYGLSKQCHQHSSPGSFLQTFQRQRKLWEHNILLLKSQKPNGATGEQNLPKTSLKKRNLRDRCFCSGCLLFLISALRGLPSPSPGTHQSRSHHVGACSAEAPAVTDSILFKVLLELDFSSLPPPTTSHKRFTLCQAFNSHFSSPNYIQLCNKRGIRLISAVLYSYFLC